LNYTKNIQAIKNIFYKLILPVLLLCNTTSLFAIGDLRIAGARQVGMGLNSISMINAYSAYNNQAAGAYLERPTFGLYYAPVFLGQGVSNISGIIAVPIKKAGTFGISVNYFGYSLFNEKKVGLSYAMKLAKFISIGIQLDYLNAKIGNGYGSKNFATFELGVLAKPIDELSIAFHVYNPLKLYVDRATGEKVQTLFRLGLTYEAIKKFFISAQIEKDLKNKLIFRGGVEYTLKEIVSFRAGVATDPVTGTFGLGINLKQGLTFDAAFSYQGNLGFQPHFGIIYTMKKKRIIPKSTEINAVDNKTNTPKQDVITK
jgi:hypothetical protein